MHNNFKFKGCKNTFNKRMKRKIIYFQQNRPSYRPNFRRPQISAQKISKPNQSNDITDTTESVTSVSTRKTTNSPFVRRRSRPTYIPTTQHTTVATILSTVANRNNDTIVNKILQRRKLGRPTTIATQINGANEKKRFSTASTKSRVATDTGTFNVC